MMKAENLNEDQQAFIKVTVKDAGENVTDVKPENNYLSLQLYAEEGCMMTPVTQYFAKRPHPDMALGWGRFLVLSAVFGERFPPIIVG